jgi:tetratricopeptide (TPR) repeat protein
MRFCPQCGAPLIAGAKFCVECGRALAGAASGAGETGGAGARVDALRRNTPITTAFVFVFVAITVVGLLAAAWIMLRTPEAVREQVAAVPPIAAAPSVGAASSNLAPSSGGAAQNNVVNPAAGGTQSGDLPAGHPRIELPTEARTFIDKIEKEAHAKPGDLAAWNKLGAVSMRAAMFDQTYYGRAEEAYGHVLKQEPDNLDALRGIGDIDYDKQHYDEAIAAYEHYLKKKPDDPEVRTDLGTMYLYTGNADQAIVQYKKAVASKPGFFQAYYNMGIAYAQENKPAEATTTLKQAMALAPDDTARKQVTDLIAKLSGAPVATPAGASTQVASPAAKSTATIAASSAAASSPTASSPAARSTVAAAAPSPAAKSTATIASSAAASAKGSASPTAAPPTAEPTAGAAQSMKDFHGAIERMVRGLPIAGPKVGSVQWPDQLKAKVLMDNFPMDQMPPFAKTKFLTDLTAGIDAAKKDNNISSPVELDIVDSASGRVMETITH